MKVSKMAADQDNVFLTYHGCIDFQFFCSFYNALDAAVLLFSHCGLGTFGSKNEVFIIIAEVG